MISISPACLIGRGAFSGGLFDVLTVVAEYLITSKQSQQCR